MLGGGKGTCVASACFASAEIIAGSGGVAKASLGVSVGISERVRQPAARIDTSVGRCGACARTTTYACAGSSRSALASIRSRRLSNTLSELVSIGGVAADVIVRGVGAREIFAGGVGGRSGVASSMMDGRCGAGRGGKGRNGLRAGDVADLAFTSGVGGVLST